MPEEEHEAGLDFGRGEEVPRLDDSTAISIKDRHDVSAGRRRTGWIVGVFGISSVSIILTIALCQLPKLPAINGETSAQLADISKGASIYLASVLAAHAIIAVSGVWFGYQVLRAAERMLVPLEYVETAKDLLGITSPHDGSAQGAKDALDSMKSYLQDIINLLKTDAGK